GPEVVRPAFGYEVHLAPVTLHRLAPFVEVLVGLGLESLLERLAAVSVAAFDPARDVIDIGFAELEARDAPADLLQQRDRPGGIAAFFIRLRHGKAANQSGLDRLQALGVLDRARLLQPVHGIEHHTGVTNLRQKGSYVAKPRVQRLEGAV